MNINRVKITFCDNDFKTVEIEKEGYLIAVKGKTLFLPSQGDKKTLWPSVYDDCYDANDWQNYIDPLLKKGVLYDPWSHLKKLGFVESELTSPLIHADSGLTVLADDEEDDNVKFFIKDNALECLYEVAEVYVDNGIPWDESLLDAIFSTKLGKDCNTNFKECKDIHSLLVYFRMLYLDKPEVVELMEINLIKEKRIKYANERL